MKLIQEIFTWEGSRKAQFSAAGLLLMATMPEQAWQIAIVTVGFVAGRALHDYAIEKK